MLGDGTGVGVVVALLRSAGKEAVGRQLGTYTCAASTEASTIRLMESGPDMVITM
jgi:hypothetical protein